MKRSLFACAKAKRRNYLHLNKKLVVGNLKWKCETLTNKNIAKNTHRYIERRKNNPIYTILILTMDKKKRYHTYILNSTLSVTCYHCKNVWEEEGLLTKFKCTKCGRWGESESSI